jgi:hypothetical protein
MSSPNAVSPKATDLINKMKQTVEVLTKQMATVNTPEMHTATETLNTAIEEVYTAAETLK